MQPLINSPLSLGSLNLDNRLIQGPLAGFSCAPFRELFYQFAAPAYCVTEMISAQDVVHKHPVTSRYLYRSPNEKRLCYQIAGSNPVIMAQAATRLEDLGADLIDINCGCPKAKIRKKGAGSALLEEPEQLLKIVDAVRSKIRIPLTVKIRIQGNHCDLDVAKMLAQAGADALIVHGRRWTDDYSKPNDFEQIAKIKASITIPVIANGDIADQLSLNEAVATTACDAYMIGRAGTGKPWLYQALLKPQRAALNSGRQKQLFMQHLEALASLESEHKALLQAKTLVRYYFKNQLDLAQLQNFYTLKSLKEIIHFGDF